MHLLAVNCGSSSIKAKLYAIPSSSSEPLSTEASLSVSGIGSKGEKVKIKVDWEDGQGKDVDEDGDDGGKVQHLHLFPMLLDKLTSSSELEKEDIKYITHRIVHGGTHTKGIRISKGHEEGLQDMDKLSEFAPLHNHHAVLAVRSCLDTLPDHTSLLLFDTLFHQTLPPEAYVYALPQPLLNPKPSMPIRKYGFHGLSYASIVRSVSQHLNKPENKINIVVAHLGSGASACCIKGGHSIDTSMGLTPLEGLIGGTRSGTIDPTAVFHMLDDPEEDAGVEGMHVTKAEILLNKKSGLAALAGTTNFGRILSDLASSSSSDREKAQLAYSVYLDRLMGYLSQYLFKLLSALPLDDIDGIVFSGGIGERAARLRADVLARLEWLGAEVDRSANEGEGGGAVRRITVEGSKVHGWVVQTDEEGWCAQLARDDFGF